MDPCKGGARNIFASFCSLSLLGQSPNSAADGLAAVLLGFLEGTSECISQGCASIVTKPLSFLSCFIPGYGINSPKEQPHSSSVWPAFNFTACLGTVHSATPTALAKQISSHGMRKQENDISVIQGSGWFTYDFSWCAHVLCQSREAAEHKIHNG